MKMLVTYRNGSFVPFVEDEAMHFVEGMDYNCEITNPRNAAFHRKYMALLKIAFDKWEPDEIEVEVRTGVKLKASKNFDRFRKDIAIVTGHYTMAVSIKGEPRAVADSISFAKMNEATFTKLYNRTIDYILKYIVPVDRDKMEEWVDQIVRFG